MYRFSYAEIAEDSASESRKREQDLFERAIRLMQVAQGTPAQSPQTIEAFVFVQRLWTVLMKDLCEPENGLPDTLKAGLLSIGLWVMRESDAIVRGEKNDLAALIEINSAICEGLK